MATENILEYESSTKTDSSLESKVIEKDQKFWSKMHDQVLLMTEYALSNGVKIPDEVKGYLLEGSRNKDLLEAHIQLSGLIAPTTPQSIEYNFSVRVRNDKTKWRFLSAYPLIRELFIVTAVFGTLFILTGLTTEVNDQNLSKGLLHSSGIPLLYNSLFISSAAALGSCFSLLTQALNKIKNVALSPGDRAYFRTTLMLGVISGLLLSEVVVTDSTQTIVSGLSLNRMILALIGGFSSELVYKTLQAILEKLKQLVSI